VSLRFFGLAEARASLQMVSALKHLADIAPERVRPLRRVEYEAMVAQGLFADERIELLEGVIVELSPHNPRHAAVVERLTNLLARAAGDRASMRVQLPLAVSEESMPEPDLALVPVADYDQAHPKTAWLVVEVADASLRKDLRVKTEVYARAGVLEYWVVNLIDHRIEVHADAAGAAYNSITSARAGESIRLRRFPDVELAVADILR
jgi:Uma2 family endonuclease